MTERFDVKGVNPATPVREAAAAILAAKCAPMFALARAAASGTDPEALHDMRVASRRVREAMSLFEHVYPRKGFARTYSEVRRVTSILGDVRDADVFISGFERLVSGATSSDELTALAYLIAFRRGQRSEKLRRLARRFAKLDLAHSGKAFEKFCAKPRKNAESAVPLAALAQDAIVSRLTSAYGFLPAALAPENTEAQHAMRIACKRLRYCVETMAPCLGEAFKGIYEPVRKFQDALGDLHDSDVFADFVKGGMESTEMRTAGVTEAGLSEVLVGLESVRAKRFVKFRRLVSDYPESRMRSAVAKALEKAAVPAQIPLAPVPGPARATPEAEPPVSAQEADITGS